jgi:3-keto-disaccharide hydrolase
MSANCIAIVVLFGVLGITAFTQDEPTGHTPQAPKAEWNFDKEVVGQRAIHWRVAETNGSGKIGTWTIAMDDTAPSTPNVLKLETKADDRTYNLLIAEKTSFKDLDLRVRIKANSGKEDQGGGVIWRCKDENNYYICRINPLEGNFRVYKVEKGKRTQLESVKLETKSGQWHEVRAVMVGDKIECYMDGKKYLEARDDTFRDAGTIGLWTKADASSSFDDVAVYEPSSGR